MNLKQFFKILALSSEKSTQSVSDYITIRSMKGNAMTQTVGQMIDRMEEIRIEKRKLEAGIKPLEEEYKGLKTKIIERLDAEGSLKASSRLASVSISEVTVPVVEDISKLIPFIARNKLWHLFLAQPLTTPAWREAVGLKGKDLPGTKSFTKRDLNHSSLK
jgi:hypothetical protein